MNEHHLKLMTNVNVIYSVRNRRHPTGLGSEFIFIHSIKSDDGHTYYMFGEDLFKIDGNIKSISFSIHDAVSMSRLSFGSLYEVIQWIHLGAHNFYYVDRVNVLNIDGSVNRLSYDFVVFGDDTTNKFIKMSKHFILPDTESKEFVYKHGIDKYIQGTGLTVY